MRPTLDEYYLEIAKVVSTRSTCLKKHYGAVIVKNNRIVSTGYNNPPACEAHCTTCTKVSAGKDIQEYETCPSCHAEQNAIVFASHADMIGADLYLAGYDVEAKQEHPNAMPCEICLRLIKNAGIARVINSTGVVYARNDTGILVRQQFKK